MYRILSTRPGRWFLINTQTNRRTRPYATCAAVWRSLGQRGGKFAGITVCNRDQERITRALFALVDFS